MTVAEAGAVFFGLSRSASYEAAKRGEIPTIKIGQRTLRVPIAAMERRMAEMLVESNNPEALTADAVAEVMPDEDTAKHVMANISALAG